MSDDKKSDSLQPEEIRSTGSPLSAKRGPRTDGAASSVVKSLSLKKPQGFFEERSLPAIDMAPGRLRYLTRRDVLLFGAGAVAALAGGGFLLPQDTLSRLGVRRNMDSPGKDWVLNEALRIDDDVAEALYSGSRRVPTYTKSQITPLKNNYNGATPDPYFMSLDLATARHPQTLLATHFNGQPLTVDHGAPLRLLVPVKLGLKNVKAITRITYSAEEARDYWAERGYSRYDGI